MEKTKEQEYKEALFDMCAQYCTDYECKHFKHRFMSAEEEAFRVLGIQYGERVEDVAKRLHMDW